MQAKKIIYLFGGPGAEHEVSINSAKSALAHFGPEFLIRPVFITKDNKWVLALDAVEASQAWPIAESLMAQSGIDAEMAIANIAETDPYVVFIGLHGQFGEDGTVQSLLEGQGLAYTGSDSEASALAFDKPKVLQMLQDEGIAVPEFLELKDKSSEADALSFIDYIGLPVVVLPADSGSSVGVTIVHNKKDLTPALNKAKMYSNRIMISEYIDGREVTCGVLATSKTDLNPLLPTELIPKTGHDFFDYDAKYVPGETKEVTPPNMPKNMILRIQGQAKKVHQLVGADGYSRTDMIINKEGIIHVLEINTLPGLTMTSIIPQQAAAAGLSFDSLLATICHNVDRTARGYVTAIA